MELREQYDRIYQYLYFRLRDRQAAEDICISGCATGRRRKT